MFTNRIDSAIRSQLLESGDISAILEHVNEAAATLRRMYTLEAGKHEHQSIDQQRWLAKAFGVDTFCDALFGRDAEDLMLALDGIYDEIDFESGRLQQAA